jgi:ABC-type dipeptide/oligopeptide/nickel transport system permease subunit
MTGDNRIETTRKRFTKYRVLIFGLSVLSLVVFAGIGAELIAPYDPNQNDLSRSLQSPDRNHWLGTDILGRDILSRLIYGSRTALIIAVAGASTAALSGMFLGLIAGYMGGWISAIIMRMVDALMCFPMLVMALLISVILGGGIISVVIALGISSIAIYARLMNGLVLGIKEKDYVTAARSMGASNFQILKKHILPNALPFMIIQIGVHLGTIILAESGLSFLGVGVRPPDASWGAMIADGYAHIATNPAMAIAPGAALMIVAFSCNTVGDALRDIYDPRLNNV